MSAKYADNNIIAAYLALQGRNLAVFVCYNQKVLLSSITHNQVDINADNTISLVSRPGDTPQLAHYNCLILNRIEKIMPQLPTLTATAQARYFKPARNLRSQFDKAALASSSTDHQPNI